MKLQAASQFLKFVERLESIGRSIAEQFVNAPVSPSEKDELGGNKNGNPSYDQQDQIKSTEHGDEFTTS